MDLTSSAVRWLAFSLLTAGLLHAAEADILSEQKRLQLQLKGEKYQEDADSLQNSWINPITLSASHSKSMVDTARESTTTSYRIGLSQDLFRSGGIYYAIQYADATDELNKALLRLEEKQLIASAYQPILNIQKTRLTIQKQKLAIENARIDVKYKQEQYQNGLTDISLLNSAIITLNAQKNALAALEETLADLIQSFSNLSDMNPDDVKMIELKPLDFDTYINHNITLEQKQRELAVKDYLASITLSAYLPKLTAEASYVVDDTESASSVFSNTDPYYSYGLTLSIPLSINAFSDIESARLQERITQSELATTRLEEENVFKSVKIKLDAIDKKIAIAQENYELYDKLLFQIREQQAAGFKTVDDVTVMENSKQSSKLDIAIYRIDRQLQLLNLHTKVVLP